MTGSRRFSTPAARTLALAAAVTGMTAALAGSSIAATGSSATLVANNQVAGLSAVAYGSSIRLSGHETLGGSRSLSLQAQAWPFKNGYTTIRSGTTTGKYSFVVSPSHATRYRVLIANGPTSPVLTVYVLDQRLSMSCNLCHGSNTPGSHTLVVTGRFRTPPGPSDNGPVYLYYGLNSSSATPATLNRVASAPRQFSGNTFSFSVSYTVQFPNTPTFRFAELFCWKQNEAATGVGLPGRHGCGNATVNRLAPYLG